MESLNLEDTRDFFLSIKERKSGFVIYSSEGYKFTEIDIINLIKICLIEQRSKAIGKKILDIYKDSTNDRRELTEKRLTMMGLPTEEKKLEIKKRPKVR